MSDPARADALYEAAVGRLRELRREKNHYPLIFSENCSYGFRRNLFGLRKVGIGIALAVTLVAATLLILSLFGRHTTSVPGLIFLLGFALGALALWTWLVTPVWVREAAEAYSERLLASAGQPWPPSAKPPVHA